MSKPLDSLDYAILKILYEHPGMSDMKISKELGVNNKTVGKRKTNPLFIQTREERDESDFARLVSLRGKAISRLDALLDSENDNVSLGAAKEVIKGLNPDTVDLTKTLDIKSEAEELLTILNEKNKPK